MGRSEAALCMQFSKEGHIVHARPNLETSLPSWDRSGLTGDSQNFSGGEMMRTQYFHACKVRE